MLAPGVGPCGEEAPHRGLAPVAASHARGEARCFNKVRSTRRAKSRPDRVEAYLERCCHLVGRAEDQSCKELEQAGAQSITIQALIAHARRQMDQVERRLLKGETIAHDEKVFSIFEPHPLGVEGQGWLCGGARSSVCGRPIPAILHHKILWEGRRYRYCGVGHQRDAGTASRPTGVQLRPWVPQPRQPGAWSLDAMLDLNALPRKGRLSVAEREREEASICRGKAPAPATSRQSTTLSIAVSTGCAPTAPMGLRTPLHCQGPWPPTCTASVCTCAAHA